MEFRLLGPVEVRVGDQVLDVGHARQRAVLAVLLLDLGRVVPRDRLVDRIWGEDPPASVHASLHGYIARLRRALAVDGEGAVLARRVGGYVLDAEQARVDLFRFRRLVADAATADVDTEAERLLRDALGLWHGPALTGLDSQWLTAMRDTLELERHAAFLDLNDVRLRLGQHAALVSELVGQAAAAPTDERLIGQLMLSLYRCGRQADALRWFSQTRSLLADDLGADPGPELRALHERILRADAALVGPSALAMEAEPPAGGGQAGSVPRELPADVSAFTGRDAELAALDELLLGSGGDARQATAAVISALSGTAGVGKTALAVHWAHRAAAEFPDGQLHVNLRGYDPAQPATAADALAGFLRSLGVPGPEIPAEEGERAARYRSLLTGKRMLVVLDNASSADQVRPLLPGHPACRVLVTSRDSLAGLVARDGARRLDLDLLPLPDAIALLRELIGAKADAEPEAVAELARQCARLPLALRVAAELAASRPAVPLAELVAELADQQRRLDLLSAEGDPRTAVRAVFSWSYGHLDEASGRAFRLAGLHPGADFEPYAMAALTDSTVDQARRVLDALTRAHLLQTTAQGRYGMHDLLRAYACDLADEVDGEDESRAALTRLFDHYLSVAAAAADTLWPAERNRRPRVASLEAPAEDVSGPDAAKKWLECEQANLVTMAVHAADNGWPGHATGASALLFRHLQVGGHRTDEVIVHSAARRAAREAGDLPGEAAAVLGLGIVNWSQGRYPQAARHDRQALALFRRAGDRVGEARALHNLGMVEQEQGDYVPAVRHYRQSMALYRDCGDRNGEATTLISVANVSQDLGQFQQAISSYRRALAVKREIGERTGEAIALANIGLIDERLGRYEAAASNFEQALALFRLIGDRSHEAYVLCYLGKLESRLAHYPEATNYQRRSVEVHREIGDLAGEADARNDLGGTLLAAGHRAAAQREHEIAMSVASQIGQKQQQARAHEGLGNCCHASGDLGRARELWERALALFTELGMPEAAEVRERLGGLPGTD